jgi:ribosomal protein S18 acetylase RimI-like enzyme
MWRVATASDDEAIVTMCLALNAEDPGPKPVTPQQVRRTLAKLRDEPKRGRAVVCDVEGRTIGYALLISFWSNELGGKVCNIDELLVIPDYRGRGWATSLFYGLATGEPSLWPNRPAALALEVASQNQRARALYERLGFRGKNIAMRLPLRSA